MKLRNGIVLLVFAFVMSCAKKEIAPKPITFEETEMINLADSLELKEAQYSDLIDSINTLQTRSDLFFRKIHIQDREIDALSSQLKLVAKENKRLVGKTKKPPLSKEEKGVQNMVFKMHKAWVELAETKNTKVLMNYFNPHFLVSRITINADDTAGVSQFSHDDFEEYLQRSIVEEEGLSVEFDAVDFLDIKIRKNSYFNVAYTCDMGTYKNDRLQETSAILVTITGKNIDGRWGISSYSWVSFKEGM